MPDNRADARNVRSVRIGDWNIYIHTRGYDEAANPTLEVSPGGQSHYYFDDRDQLEPGLPRDPLPTGLKSVMLLIYCYAVSLLSPSSFER